MNPKYPLARRSGLVVQNAGSEVLVYDMTTNTAYCLNETAAFVWQKCDGHRSVDAMTREFSKAFGPGDHRSLVNYALASLGEKGLVTHSARTVDRRRALRAIGLTSAVAVPVIASLVAPPSTLALSTCGCVNPGDCVTQTTCPSTVNCNGSGHCAP